MPTFLAPHKSGAHRTAAIALYRALLKQSTKLPHQQHHPEIYNLIRRRFRDQKFNTSAKQLKVYFTAGYEAVDVLDGAVRGGREELGRVRGLVEAAREVEGRRREGMRVKEVEGKEKGYHKGEVIVNREKIDLLSRPLPKEKLTGQRKVPVLVDAGSIPILRLTKPQPRSLSLYLHSRIQQRQRRHDHRHYLEDLHMLAREEDRWDGLVGGKEEGVWWSWEVQRALGEVQGKLQAERERNREWAERLQGVVDREREAMEWERGVEERVKMERRKMRKVEKIRRKCGAADG
ncbi:hypothetical protein M409DRAFT_50850 [Zasmidium cellare ATCC 36951]|uniref:Complex 1 LYR protein domain-containing protein n=1 Tax=Zasmidium cellare ATCC 36951 TaxID=1080233 RepID=A0A6A6CW82_ZASCE|nr:uncharacterized protein M409DRAFT_50850 [Zasmidium cellare ATCC 36951]KAF2171404.1 hypothetical protein M409DRAFT_50850 [Zasmidium cellare ATCC 36951]